MLSKLIIVGAIGLGFATDIVEAGSACANKFNSRSIKKSWIEKQINGAQNPSPLVRQIRYLTQATGTHLQASEVLALHHSNYTHTLETGTETNQKATGRCWIFAPLNMLRSLPIAQNYFPKDFQFSQSYLWFFSLLEQANQEVEILIDTLQRKTLKEKTFRSRLTPHIGEGGRMAVFLPLIEKYGLVPQSAMPDTPILHSPRVVASAVEEVLFQQTRNIFLQVEEDSGKVPTREELRVVKEKTLNRVFEVLVSYLGIPPQEFDLNIYSEQRTPRRHANLTVRNVVTTRMNPQELKSFVGFNAKDWVILGSSPLKAYGEYYEWDQTQDVLAEKRAKDPKVRRLNLTMDRLMQLTERSIENGIPVTFSADFSKYNHNENRILHPALMQNIQTILENDGQALDRAYDRELALFLHRQGSNHQMTILGFDRPSAAGPAVKYLVENSHKNHVMLHMYREWFARYVYDILYPVKLLNQAERNLLDKDPVRLTRDESSFF